MASWIIPLFSILLPLVAADCTGFNFTGQYGSAGFATTYNATFPTTPFMNCTTANALVDPSNKDGDNNTCPIHRYGMGLIVHPEVRFVKVDNSTAMSIYNLISQNAGAGNSGTDFNNTIVMNHTTLQNGLYVGQTGYIGFTPHLRCWDGQLSGCDDSSLNNQVARACGIMWLDSRQWFSPPERQLYDGDEVFVRTESQGSRTGDPQPAYADVANQATYTTLSAPNKTNVGGHSARVSYLALSMALVMALSMAN